MAAVHVARHPSHLPHQHSLSSSSATSHSPFRRVHRTTYAPPGPGKSSSASQAAAAASSSSSQQPPRAHHAHHPSSQPATAPCVDTYYGHEDTSKICARFVSHTFNCPETIPLQTSSNSNATAVASRNGSSAGPQPPQIPNTLAHFVAYALHRTRLHASVVFTALALLHRLKQKFPLARGSSGHRLFLAAYMLASKVVCDDTYSNKSWAVVGQGMFALREINQMEREMLGYLEWNLNIPGEDLTKFEKEVRRIYGNGSSRDTWGRGIEMRLTSGVGGAKPSQDDSSEETSSLTLLAIPSTGATTEKSPPHQLPTPVEGGPAIVPAPSRPVLAPIRTSTAKPAYPSPPQSPPSVSTALNAMCDSDCTSTSTSPVDGDSESESEDDGCPYEANGSPSPTSSEDSATLPTPPNSALSAGPHHRGKAYSGSGYPQKMGKSHSVPGFLPAPKIIAGREIGRSSAPPIAATKREPVVASVSASHFVPFTSNVEEDGDAVMELEDEKRGGMTYYTSVHVPRPTSSSAVTSRASASAAVRKDTSSIREREREREIREGAKRERERSLRTYTVPCAW